MSCTIASVTCITSRALIFGKFLEIFKLKRLRHRVTPFTTLASSTSKLFSDKSSLLTHLMPGSAFSMTVAPAELRLLLEMFSSTSLMFSLQARPRRRCFSASPGSLLCDKLRYLRHAEVAKNCLKAEGGASLSLDFLARKGLRDRLRCERWATHPRTKALNRSSEGISVVDRSRMEIMLGCASRFVN